MLASASGDARFAVQAARQAPTQTQSELFSKRLALSLGALFFLLVLFLWRRRSGIALFLLFAIAAATGVAATAAVASAAAVTTVVTATAVAAALTSAGRLFMLLFATARLFFTAA